MPIDALLAVALLFAVGAATGAVPLASAEAFLVGFLLLHPGTPPWWVAAVAVASGQLCGKVTHVVAARRAATSATVRRVRTHRLCAALGDPLGPVSRSLSRCARHRGAVGGMVLLSSTVGLPPFTALVPAVAVAPVDLWVAVPVAALGRLARFLLLAAVPGALGPLLW